MQEMDIFDQNGDGTVTLQEAHDVLEQALGYSMDKTKALFKMCDKNGDNRLNAEEFITFFFKMRTK